MKKQHKRVAVIRNGHTQAQMRQLDNEYGASEALSLTLQQAMELAEAQQAQQTHEKSA